MTSTATAGPARPRRAGRAAVAAGLAVALVAGCSGEPAASPAARASPTFAGPAAGPALAGGVAAATPASPAALTNPTNPASPANPTNPADPAAAGPGAATPAPVGWSLADVPTFPAPPAAKPITLPASGSAPYLSRIPTDQPVAFITIDDGYLKHPEAPKLLAAAHVPVTLFLTIDLIKDDVGYFTKLQALGADVEAHTISHPTLRGKSYAFQRKQVCGSADKLATWYGRRPQLFRPPFGEKDATTLKVTRDCGLRAAFFWKETVHKGKVRYQEGHTVKRGDVILMHFRPAFVADFLAALRAVKKAGLVPARLIDYVAPAR
jgi:peptidoglycan/xylan/chitin deacetylase (PgdA/CDA1 family)